MMVTAATAWVEFSQLCVWVSKVAPIDSGSGAHIVCVCVCVFFNIFVCKVKV